MAETEIETGAGRYLSADKIQLLLLEQVRHALRGFVDRSRARFGRALQKIRGSLAEVAERFFSRRNDGRDHLIQNFLRQLSRRDAIGPGAQGSEVNIGDGHVDRLSAER